MTQARFHLIDGGLSTELARLGANVSGELWTGRALLDDRRLVEQAHRNYAEAGASVVITASYQLSRQGFEEIGLTALDARQALLNSVEVARRGVAGTTAKVAASVGPYGAVLHDGSEYRGDYKVDQAFLEDFHAERLEVLLEAKPDFLAVETIPNVVEARALAEVLNGVEVPTWISFTAATESQLWSGEPIAEAAAAVAQLGNLVAIGVNCVAPELVEGLLRNIGQVTSIPKIAYPNRGGVWDSVAGKWNGQEPQPLSEFVPDWLAAGASWIGGCCETSSVEIAALARSL